MQAIAHHRCGSVRVMQHMADTVQQWLELQRVLTAGGGGTLSICSLLITTGQVEFHQMQMLISEHLSLWCNDYWCLDAKHHTGGLKHALPPSSNSMPLPLLWSWSIYNPAHAEQCFVALFNAYTSASAYILNIRVPINYRVPSIF